MQITLSRIKTIATLSLLSRLLFTGSFGRCLIIANIYVEKQTIHQSLRQYIVDVDRTRMYSFQHNKSYNL